MAGLHLPPRLFWKKNQILRNNNSFFKTLLYSLCQKTSIENFDSRSRTTTRTRYHLEFFRVFSKNKQPLKLHCTLFTRKASAFFFIEGGWALFWSQNDKTSNIWWLVFINTTLMLKIVVEWRQLSRFPAKMTVAHATLLSTGKTNLKVSVAIQILGTFPWHLIWVFPVVKV